MVGVLKREPVDNKRKVILRKKAEVLRLARFKKTKLEEQVRKKADAEKS